MLEALEGHRGISCVTLRTNMRIRAVHGQGAVSAARASCSGVMGWRAGQGDGCGD
ncbi:MAG: hypothetical protein ACK559_18975 [bacterium]